MQLAQRFDVTLDLREGYIYTKSGTSDRDLNLSCAVGQ